MHLHLIKFTHSHTNFVVRHRKASPTLEEMKADFKPMSAEEKDTDAIWCGELLDLFSPDDKNPVCAQQAKRFDYPVTHSTIVIRILDASST